MLDRAKPGDFVILNPWLKGLRLMSLFRGLSIMWFHVPSIGCWRIPNFIFAGSSNLWLHVPLIGWLNNLTFLMLGSSILRFCVSWLCLISLLSGGSIMPVFPRSRPWSTGALADFHVWGSWNVWRDQLSTLGYHGPDGPRLRRNQEILKAKNWACGNVAQSLSIGGRKVMLRSWAEFIKERGSPESKGLIFSKCISAWQLVWKCWCSTDVRKLWRMGVCLHANACLSLLLVSAWQSVGADRLFSMGPKLLRNDECLKTRDSYFDGVCRSSVNAWIFIFTRCIFGFFGSVSAALISDRMITERTSYTDDFTSTKNTEAKLEPVPILWDGCAKRE